MRLQISKSKNSEPFFIMDLIYVECKMNNKEIVNLGTSENIKKNHKKRKYFRKFKVKYKVL